MSTVRDIRPTWAEIDLAAFTRNVDAIVGRLPKGSQLIAVLKANAYGHGAVELAKRCRPDRVAMIATALGAYQASPLTPDVRAALDRISADSLRGHLSVAFTGVSASATRHVC